MVIPAVRRFGSAVLAPLGFLLAAPAAAATTKTGKFFRVVCDFENDRTAALALEAADATWPIAAKLFGSPDAGPEKPFDVHLFRTQAAYEKADAEVSGGKFKKNLCFAHPKTMSAYVLLQPQCSDDALATIGLPLLTRRLLVHEAAHLVGYTALPNYDSQPNWLSDGAAAWIEEETLTALGLSPGLEKEPESSTDILRAFDLLDRKQLPGARDIFRDEFKGLGFYERHAVTGLFFRSLKTGKQRPAFDSILAEARRLGGGGTYADRLFQSVETTWGAEGLAVLDAEFVAFLRARTPEWDQGVHGLRSLEPAGKDWISIAFPESNAVAWRTESTKGTEFSITGELEIWPGPNRQLNVLLARAEPGFLVVAFVADYGVTVFHYHAKEERWEKLGTERMSNLDTGKKTGFRVDVRDDRIDDSVEGKKPARIPLGGRETKGPWGLGAYAGSAGRWSSVRLRE
ncbi:MAG TPA: hypothetical protein VFI25_06265 [Planctomycetota bacterium]|jgi:hypothetical protein|nr:hypothetical protein [Planctomycetota bacterium]